MISSLLCGAAVCAMVLPVSALAAEKINVRERQQRSRIRQGVRSGELTRQEASRLKAEEARIRAGEARAKADGTMTAAERERLNQKLNQASHDIYQQKHDEQDR